MDQLRFVLLCLEFVGFENILQNDSGLVQILLLHKRLQLLKRI